MGLTLGLGLGVSHVYARRATVEGRLIYDSFSGSGTTAIASHAPDIAPTGCGWSTAVGAANVTAGRVTPTGNFSTHIINTGASDYEITGIMGVKAFSDQRSGFIVRSSSNGASRILVSITGSTRSSVDYSLFTASTTGTALGTCNLALTEADQTIRVSSYRNLVQVSSGGSVTAIYSTCYLGASNTFVGIGGWLAGGDFDDFAVRPATGWTHLTVMGDSISISTGDPWPSQVARGYQTGKAYLMNHGVGGAHVAGSAAGDMSTQVTAAASDLAHILITELGTNDADDANIGASYAAYVNSFLTSNPGATVYCMGILPKTTPGARVANNTRLSAICTACGWTFWPTDDWIDPATDTSDGLHPTVAGMTKVATQVLARL